MKDISKTIILPIFLSILATIIYTKFIDPNFDSAIIYLSKFFSYFSDGYLNYVYENIGDGIREIFSYSMYSIIFGAFMTFMIFFLMFNLYITIRAFKKDDVINDDDKVKEDLVLKSSKIFINSKFFSLLQLLTSIFIFFYFISQSIKHHYTYNAIIYIEKSLDILAPKLSENERLSLRAEYRNINTYDKFKQFDDKIKKLSKERNAPLPDFKLIMQ